MSTIVVAFAVLAVTPRLEASAKLLAAVVVEGRRYQPFDVALRNVGASPAKLCVPFRITSAEWVKGDQRGNYVGVKLPVPGSLGCACEPGAIVNVDPGATLSTVVWLEVLSKKDPAFKTMNRLEITVEVQPVPDDLLQQTSQADQRIRVVAEVLPERDPP
jgi:hypothetical protein